MSRGVMQIGIFAKTFARPTLAATLDAVVSHGLRCVQFNLACAGVPSMPNRIDPALVATIRREMDTRQITMAAVSGTFNMIHPDLDQRRAGMRRLRELAAACAGLRTTIITLCTGTRDPENMWRRHPDNNTPEAWRDLLESMHEAVIIAEEYGVMLAFEPEVSNVIDSASKGRRLLDELSSLRLKVVIDAANLFHAGELPRMHIILEEAFALLGKDIVIAHAKDLSRDGEAGHEAAGQGVLDYDHYLTLLRAVGFTGPLILHGLDETQVNGAVAFLREKLACTVNGGAP
jgi:sugar phosphate isomerase/epimerase